jgi:hypothetical protein
MRNNSNITLYHKIIVCFLAGLACGASFNRLAGRLLGLWFPENLIDPVTLIIVIVPLAYAFYWQRRQRNNEETGSTLTFWQGVVRFAIAFDLCMFGWLKIFHLQFWVPMEKLDEPFGNLSSQWLTWMYFGRSYPMDFTIGVFQIIGSLLLLFNRTRLIGVFVIIPVLLNVFLIGLFYEMGLVVVHAGIMFAAITYLLLSEYDRLNTFFLNSNERIPSTKIKSGIKVILRCSVFVVPLLFIAMHKSADEHPQLKGKYEVERILINNVDRTQSINCDSVLSVVYLEVGNTCILQFKNYKQRMMGIYQYKEGSDRFIVDWLDHKLTSKLEGTLVQTGAKKMKLNGKIGNDTLDVELLKVK